MACQPRPPSSRRRPPGVSLGEPSLGSHRPRLQSTHARLDALQSAPAPGEFRHQRLPLGGPPCCLVSCRLQRYGGLDPAMLISA